MIILRILAGAVLLFSILFTPLWVSVVLAFAGMIYFNIFWEAAVLFLLSDALYGINEAKFYGTYFVSFFIFLIALLIIEMFKKKLKFYN
ncbi:hypothetical protein HYW73_01885 [Candidatus Nomurabacteria bacterium]|nr:hypothetical protein [Candidatus Nomurabacteria bacterium]